MPTIRTSALALVGAITLASGLVLAQTNRPGEYPRGEKPSPMMNFFVTSVPVGDGGNLGGLAGADAHCQTLAAAVGAGNRTWHAYLSTQARPGVPAVNARDRIGKGPWYNAKGVLIASNVGDLHGDNLRDRNNIQKANMLDRKSTRLNSSHMSESRMPSSA